MTDHENAIAYADPGYQADGKKRYPLDGEPHIRAAWAFIHMAGHAAAYTAGELDQIKARIVAAWKAEIDPAGPPAAGPRERATPLSERAVLDQVHDSLKALTGGDCCKPAVPMGRHSKTLFGHLKDAHDALCRAGARCDEFVPDMAETETADRASHTSDLMKAFAGEIVPRLDALARRVEEIAAVPLPPLTMARVGAGLSKSEDAGYFGLSPDDVAAALARMSDEDRTLALIKAAHANPIRPFAERSR